MRRNHLCCSFVSFLTVLSWPSVLTLHCGKQEYLNREGRCAPCLQCPPGQEPDRECGFGNGLGAVCIDCATGTFSESLDLGPCRPHTRCDNLKHYFLSSGTSTTDAVCGECLSGFYTTTNEPSFASECLPCSSAPQGTAGCEGYQSPFLRVLRSGGKNAPKLVGNGIANTSNISVPEEKTTEYAVFALVPIFCVMGLLGILICNILKKKGYSCTAEKEGGDVEAGMAEKDGNPCPYTLDDTYEDTISVLVRLITEKKENAAALEELLKDYESKQISVSKKSLKFPPLPQLKAMPNLCRHQHHLHTVHGLAPPMGTCCTRCSQKKWPELLMPIDTTKTTKVGTKSHRPGEMAILSVGRFRVAHIPELKSTPLEELTPPESSDTDSIDTTHTEPVEQKSLLGGASTARSKNKRLKPGDSKLEDRKVIIRLGEANLVF
ncbi:tumor necrosis factor receptor superfamily member 19L-like isoform X1 [Huso huso]|uniref:Tumor necrosis factor receptor superfamily member 19L-like isoform X1 n=1 Tax=Huso huso TaxID=61971 RepID=A0ABR0ZML5_HUSHU